MWQWPEAINRRGDGQRSPTTEQPNSQTMSDTEQQEQPQPDQSHDEASNAASEQDTGLWRPGGQRRPQTTLHTLSESSSNTAQPPSSVSPSPLSPGAQDRVFPIRSAISVDPNPTPSTRSVKSEAEGFFQRPSSESSATNPPTPATPFRSRHDGDYGFQHTPRISGPDRRRSGSNVEGTSIQHQMTRDLADNASSRSEDTSNREPSQPPSVRSTKSNKSVATDEPDTLVTARFKHIMTEGGHAVITGRGGETLQRCEDEPIHIPGAIQSFGLLIALQDSADGKLLVRVASENSKKLIGYSPKDLFALESFTDILTDEQADNLLDHIDFIKDEDADPATNGPEVFTLSVRHPSTKKQTKLWCGMHINERQPHVIICEFELEDDQVNPLVPPEEAASPEPPVDSLHGNPTAEELAESTINMSKPLRVLRSARKRRGETAAMEVFNIMAQVQEQLASAPNLEVFLRVLVGVVKELTGFHRVMVYQFDQQWNGRVVSELVDPRATKDLYKGLNFPASDIPKQARDLYKINRVRLLYDRDQETARLVCRTMEDLETPLDMTYGYLRAMSPIHIKYLKNMAVRASMSISINAFDELWGLISCHAYGAKGMRVSFPIRKMCRLIGETASRNIERLSYASRLQARKLINTVPTEQNPSGYIIASSDDLLKLFDADCGLVSIGEETKILGHLDSTQEALALLEYLRLRRMTSVTTSQDIRMDFPDLRYPPGFQVIAGLLLVPLSVGGSDFIVFFRRGQLREVKWAGNPYSKFIREGTEGYLEPRTSFQTWTETVVGKCREWSEEQVETAAVLCLIYGKFIEVWRQKEAALQNSQLTKLLLANSAHEVRTPLNAIINYLEIAMEGSLDQETRDNLSRSHSASKSLIYVINDLLDLTKTEEGKDLVVRDAVFDLHTTIEEATSSFKEDAARKKIIYKVNDNPQVPKNLVGDQRRLRQAIFNVVANAIQHTTSGTVSVDTYLAQSTGDHVELEFVISDSGSGMTAEELDTLFTELEQVQTEDERSKEQSQEVDKRSSSKERRVLGLGLAVVSRIVRNMNGQLRVKSEEGKGSRFVLQLGFDIPAEDGTKTNEGGTASSATPAITEGEMTLVRKTSQASMKDRPTSEVGRRNSQESMNSLNSMKSVKSGSSGKSDMDRLIDAIQEPHMVPRSPSRKGVARSGSTEGRPASTSSSILKSQRPSLSRSQTEASLPASTQHQGSELYLPYSRSSETKGQYLVTDQGTPIRPVRMPDEADQPHSPPLGPQSKAKGRVSFDSTADRKQESKSDASPSALRVLVAEDDPINSKIISKRLEKLRYKVTLTVNGEACATVHADNPGQFDAVLMDIQMPIVDGLTSTKMIRSQEKANPGQNLSVHAASIGRIPIFAVSASLVEREKDNYIETGFDGWILKPIDFKRLDTLLHGITDRNTRLECLYKKGEWEKGGWFRDHQGGADEVNTRPDPDASVKTESKIPKPFPPGESSGNAEGDISKEQERLGHLEKDAVHDESRPENPGDSGNIDESVSHVGNAAGS